VSKKLGDLGQEILNQINEEKRPSIRIPVRSLSNIIWDEEQGLLKLGGKTSRRYFFNVAHARKFMQTLLVASFCKEIVDENIHASIRDMYYNLKRTLGDSKENTFEEQTESVCPDEPLLVRINGKLTIKPGSEILDYALNCLH